MAATSTSLRLTWSPATSARDQLPFAASSGASLRPSLPSSLNPRRTLRGKRRERPNALLVLAAKTKKKDKATEYAPTPVSGITVVESEEPNSRVRLTVTVPGEACKKVWDKAIRDIGKEIQIDGFRKGDRVPEYLLVRHVGEDAVKRQVLEDLLHSTLPEALDTVAGRALKDSEHIAQKADDLVGSFSPTESFSYDVTVDVIPEVQWVSERAHASLAVEVEVEDSATVADAVERQIRSRHKDLGSLRVSLAGGVKMGDVVVVDISAFRIKEDGATGEPIYSATSKGFQFDTEESAFNLLPGFVEALMGLERAQSREFDLQFPATWQLESLRGVQGRFQVACQEVFERDLPPLDDASADKFLPGAKSMDEVRVTLTTVISRDREQKKKQATMLALVEALGEVCAMAVPPSLLEEQGRQMYGAKLIELQSGGRLSKDDAAQLMTEQMVNNYLVAQKDKIEKQVKQALAVQEVFRLEKLTFSDEELKAECDSAIAEFKAYGQEYDEKRVREQAEELLEGGKVLEWLINNSTVTYKIKATS